VRISTAQRPRLPWCMHTALLMVLCMTVLWSFVQCGTVADDQIRVSSCSVTIIQLCFNTGEGCVIAANHH
jgi:hypothetical protein